MPLGFAPSDAVSLPLTVLEPAALDTWRAAQPERLAAWVEASGFAAAVGEALVLPGADGRPAGALAGYGTAEARARGRFALAAAVAKLPAGTWHLDGPLPDPARLEEEALGWLLTAYRFERYLKPDRPAPERALKAPAGVDAARIETLANSEALTRDLINTPAADMGPEALETACSDLARDFGASIEVTRGDDLLAGNFPLIHAVGRAAHQAPRLIDLRWGAAGPRLTLVGKGVCFDTGGLDIKPAQAMGLMKKDMGGAANVLGLARAIMALGWPVRLRVLIPAVENAIAGNAFRPGDILTSRKGLTVEVNN
ncbi:MAG: leucyl aminopeptidase family protein, partial [Paracoccaceae bacterium]